MENQNQSVLFESGICEKFFNMKKSVKIVFTAIFCFIFCSSPFFSQKVPYSVIKSLMVKPVNENNYIGSECLFELRIPNIRAEQVQSSIPTLPAGVSFLSLRRSDYFDVNSGAKIEIWLSFSAPGNYKIPALNVFFNNKSYKIPFELVEILEDPRNREPQVIISFEDGREFVYQRRNRDTKKFFMEAWTGKPVVFTVSLQYAIQLFSLEWVLPKDAYIKQLKKIEFKADGNNSYYSADKIPVGIFEWEPFSVGKTSFPDFNIIATSYNGVRVNLSLPSIEITVKDSGKSAKDTNSDKNYFAYAFIDQKKISSEKKVIAGTREDFEILAELRMAERKEFLNGQAHKKRVEFEQKLNIEGSKNEVSIPFMKILFIAAISFFVLMIVFIVLKKMIPVTVFSLLFIAFMCFFIVVHVQLLKKTGIFMGGDIYSVPEITAQPIDSIEKGYVVQIEQVVSDWYFIKCGNAAGWVKSDCITLIE